MNKGIVLHVLLNSLRLWAALALYLAPATVFAQAISDIRIDTPRDFGYTIGDIIRHEMRLSLSEPFQLDTTNLPDVGRLNRWLEISRAETSVEYGEQNALYRITVDYQIFNAPQQLTSVTIPQLEFLTTGGANPIPVFMPEWTFSIGPVTDSSDRNAHRLRPDRQPQAIPLKARQIRLLILTLLLTGLLSYLAYRRWLLPRLNREQYPFFSALEELRRLQQLDSPPENYRLGLQKFHAAVNATAGQVIFAENLPDFLATHASYRTLKTEFSALYTRSQDIFFNNSEVEEPETWLRELVDLCRHCRTLERSVT